LKQHPAVVEQVIKKIRELRPSQHGTPPPAAEAAEQE